MRPGEVVNQLPLGHSPPLGPDDIQATQRREGAAACDVQSDPATDRELGESLGKVGRLENGAVPDDARCKFIHHARAESVRPADFAVVLRLVGDCIEDGVHGICVGGLKPVLSSKLIPHAIAVVHVLIHLDQNELIVGQNSLRECPAQPAAGPVRDGGVRRSRRRHVERRPVLVEWAAEYRCGGW